MEENEENGMEECPSKGKGASNMLEMMKMMMAAQGESPEEAMEEEFEEGDQGEPKMDEKALHQLAKMLKLKSKN